MRASRFFRTPKGLVLVVLALLAGVAGVREGLSVITAIAIATVPAMAIDALILRRTKGRWAFPSGALLTGLIVAMILNPRSPWYVIAVTSVLGVASKYIVRGHTANVFNPAALALVATFYVFNPAQNWWGALPALPMAAVVVLLATGIFITHKIAGPIYKMKQLLRQVGQGKLNFRGGLRKGDELQHFFDAFLKMADDLKARQQNEVEMLEAGIASAKGAGASEESLAKIIAVHAEMKDSLKE